MDQTPSTNEELAKAACASLDDALPGAEPVSTVLFHGVCASPAIWHGHEDKLGKGAVLNLPLPGHHPWSMDGKTTEALLSDEQIIDCYANIISQRSTGPVRVFAHSTGALIALMLAERHPSLVRHMVLTGGFCCGTSAVQASMMARNCADPWVGGYVFNTLWSIWLSSERLFDLGMRSVKAAHTGQGPSAAELRIMKDLISSQPEAVRAVVRWLARSSIVDRLQHIETPTTVILSRDDPVVPVVTQMQLVRTMPNAHGLFIDSGHVPMIEDPEKFDALIARMPDFANPATSSLETGL